jgi:hypothetical protein
MAYNLLKEANAMSQTRLEETFLSVFIRKDFCATIERALKCLLVLLLLSPGAHAASDTMAIRNVSGSALTNYPVQFGRWFKAGEFPAGSYPQVVVNGAATVTQADVKNAWQDGSLKYAVISFLLPSLANAATTNITFQSSADCHCGAAAGLTQAQMLDGAYNFDAQIQTTLGSASARTMLTNGSYTYWIQGSIATTIILADHSATRSYDFGSDANKSLRPIFHATFWPGINKVFVRAILEDSDTIVLQHQAYDVTVTLGSSSPATLYSKTSYTQYLGTRWSRVGWIGGTPLDGVNIDHNLAYLTEAKAVPNFDTTKIPSSSQLTTQYSAFQAADNGIGGQGVYSYKSMATAGGRPELNPFPLWDTLWLYTGDYRMRLMTLRTADLAASWPMYWREGNTAKSSMGKPISLIDRPTFRVYGGYGSLAYLNSGTVTADQITPLEDVNTTGGWCPNISHLYQPHYVSYLLTGDFYYLEDAWFWASWMLFGTPPGGCAYCRGPGASAGIDDEVRGDAWGVLRRTEFWALLPDSMTEKATYRRYVVDALANWEGKYRITGTALDGDSVKTWQQGINYWSSQTGGSVNTPSPLHFWEYNLGLTEGLDTTKAGGGTSPWMHNYLVYGLGRVVELGISEGAGSLAWAGQASVDMTTQTGVLNPQAVGQYRIPTINADLSWMTTWTQVAAGYGTYDLNAFWATGSGGITQGLNGYPYIAQAALSMTTNLPNGAAAWNWISAQTQNQTLQNDYPTWAILPRAATIPPPSACDLNQDGNVDILDVQSAVNQAIGQTPCTNANLRGTGSCDVVDVQRIVNAALGGACVVGP